MRLFRKRWIFLASFLLGAGWAFGSSAYYRWEDSRLLQARQLSPSIAVAEQVSLESVRVAGRKGFDTIIDLRPDGEAVGQPSSAEVGQAARQRGMKFYYVPVPHGDIPDSAVAQLDQALSNSTGGVLLYCRSGRRAARTWSLVEASRPDGMDANAILAAVKAAGQSADDLETAIRKRIAARPAAPKGSP